MNNKSIDINQRIPLDTLYAALEAYLNNSYSNEYVLEQLRLEYKGENRLKKALRIVNRIIPKSPLISLIEENNEELKFALRNKQDRSIILISLLNAAFAFSYDVLALFGKYFSVQEIVNSEVIKKTIANTYGGNRATENGIYSVIPMFLEAGLFERPKQGFYQWQDKVTPHLSITKTLYLMSFKVNNEVNEFMDYQILNPYFLFIEMKCF